jgi:hypothetical protein
MNDSAFDLICNECGDIIGPQYYIANSKNLCRKCYNTYMLQNKQYTVISNYCTCDGPVEISTCIKCGKLRFKSAKKKES